MGGKPMPGSPSEHLAEEIGRLRRRFASIMRLDPSAVEAPAHWTCVGAYLRWHVLLEEVVEPDIDVEIQPDLFIVRARPEAPGRRRLQALLPIPMGFDPHSARIRCEYDYLEVRLTRSAPGGDA